MDETPLGARAWSRFADVFAPGKGRHRDKGGTEESASRRARQDERADASLREYGEPQETMQLRVYSTAELPCSSVGPSSPPGDPSASPATGDGVLTDAGMAEVIRNITVQPLSQIPHLLSIPQQK